MWKKNKYTVISQVSAHPRVIAHLIFWANIATWTVRCANTPPTRMTRPRILQLEDVRDKVKQRRKKHFSLFMHFFREQPQSGSVSVRKENDGDNEISLFCIQKDQPDKKRKIGKITHAGTQSGITR